MKYRYYINDVEVSPEGEWEINYQRNEGQIFFRRILEGELTFGGDDYTFIKGLSCEIATFDIWCGGAIHWEGQFQYPYKAKFDDDSCTVVITPEVIDEYTCIMANYETEFFTNPSIGGLSPDLETCAAVNMHFFAGTIYPILDSGTAYNDWIGTVLNGTAEMDCDLTVASSFFFRSNFANGDNYAGAYGTNNYITGVGNRLEYIHLMTNSTIRNNFGSAVCGSPRPYTFKMFEELLRNAFNAYWFIDENGAFRVEHIYYFDPAFPNSDYTVGKDLTTVMDRGGRSFAYHRNKYEYETGRLYDQERWTWQHYEGDEGTIPVTTHGQDFEGVPVFYGVVLGGKSNYVPGDFKEKEFACPKFWADIEWAFDVWAAVGDTDVLTCPVGFCMLDIDVVPGTLPVRCETGALSGANIINGHCSTANLQNHYHRYDRIFNQGNMNSVNEIFLTAQKHKLQDPIEFPLCCNETFDPLNRIRTGLGDGEVKAAVQKKQSIEVELWHEFDCTDLVGCIPSGCIMWDGINDRVQLATPPLVDIAGDRIIKMKAYLYSDNDGGVQPMCQFHSGTVSDLLRVQFMPTSNQLGTYVKAGGGIGTSREWDLLSNHYNKCISIEIEKTGRVITACSIDGIALTNDGTSPSIGAMTTSDIGYYATLFTEYLAIWDIKIYDFTPTLLHHWKGYPAGNTNAAWLDQVAAADGTVTGTPNIYP